MPSDFNPTHLRKIISLASRALGEAMDQGERNLIKEIWNRASVQLTAMNMERATDAANDFSKELADIMAQLEEEK